MAGAKTGAKKSGRTKTVASKAAKVSTGKSKKVATQAVAKNPLKPRQIKPKHHKILRHKNRPSSLLKLPSAWRITKTAGKLLMDHWRIILGIVVIYGVCNIILVRGFNGGLDVAKLKATLNQLSTGGWGHFASAFTIYGQLVSSSNSVSSDVAGAYQTFLLLITSLALVWTFRELRKGKQVRARDGFYFGVYPLIPVLLILLVIGLQLVPLLIGGWLFTTVVQNGIAVSGLEIFLWGMLFFASALISLYMICSSIFALYIATLPGMTPFKALRSARGLVKYRRSSVVRKLVFLPLILLLLGSLIMLPFILFAAVLAQWIFFALSMMLLAVVHAYMYTLYRELLHEKV